jgi:hypothetical protein
MAGTKSVEAVRRERDEHRFDDDVEPVATPQRMWVADDDGANRVAVGLGEVTGEVVAIGRRELYVFHGPTVPSGRGYGS